MCGVSRNLWRRLRTMLARSTRLLRGNEPCYLQRGRMPRFRVSLELAGKAAQIADRRIDVTARRVPNPDKIELELARSELGERFTKMLAGFAAMAEMRGNRNLVIATPGLDFSKDYQEEVLHFLGLPGLADFEGATGFIVELFTQFIGWLQSQGGILRYQWGTVALLDDGSVMLVLEDSSTQYKERGTRARLLS